MNDFWSRKLGNNQPARQAPPPASAPQQGPWWQPQQQQAAQPQQQPQVVYDQAGNAYVMGPGGQLQPVQVQQSQDQLAGRKLPPSARSAQTCPECGSADYAITGKGFNKSNGSFDVWKCFDCGYPVKQEFSGMTSVSDSGGIAASKQVAHGGGSIHNFSGQQLQAPAFAAEHGGPGR